MSDLGTLPQGSSLVSIYPVFRNGQWQRVPALMLVEDDIIALGTGDVTPARVEQLAQAQGPGSSSAQVKTSYSTFRVGGHGGGRS